MKRTVACLLFALTWPAAALSQDAGRGVRVRLELAGGKEVYRAGEPIRLVLSFTGRAGEYQLNTTTTKPASPVDDVILSPDAGVSRWLEEYSGGNRYAPDYASLAPVSPTPTRVELPLNDWFRFDRPGRYTVRVRTARVSRAPSPGGWSPPAELTTNEVSFEVVAMKEAEEREEVRRLSARLDAAKGWQEEAAVSEELSFLTGEAATREKVRRFLNPRERSGNFFQNIYFGLFMARDRALAVRLLESAWRDPNATATHQLLHTLTKLRLMQEGGASVRAGGGQSQAEGEGRSSDILREYVGGLLAGLPKRSGKNLTAAAMVILGNLPKEPAEAAAPLAAVREILLREFDSLHPFDQEYLLRVFWEQLRDPSLAPALERVLAKHREPQAYLTRTSALKRLLELRPERARPFVLAEIRDPDSFVELEVLSALEDETLPEADSALLEQIRRLAPLTQNGDFVRLRHKALLAARYASPAIYDGLLEAYQTHGAKWPADVRAGVLGHLARYNESQAAPLIEQALAELGPGQDSTFFLELTRANYPEAVNALLRKRLEGEDPQAVSAAAYVMSQHGPPEGRRLIEARLERWEKEWGARGAELDAAGEDPQAGSQRMAQLNLIEALLLGKSWKLPEQEAERLKRGCATRQCREHFQIR